MDATSTADNLALLELGIYVTLFAFGFTLNEVTADATTKSNTDNRFTRGKGKDNNFG